MSLPIITTWTHLKDIVNSKKLPIQYEYNLDGYEIFAVDGIVFYSTVIYNNAVPDPSIYSQVQNDADKAEFLLTYYPIANRVITPNAVRDGYLVETNPLLIAGQDGSNLARIFRTDTNGRGVFVGAGTAGTPVGGVLTIQGDPSGAPIPISGSITANNASVGLNNAVVPGSSTQIGGTDGTNLQSVHVFDADTGGGTQYVLGVGLRKSASGGSVDFGTPTDPIRVDPTGTTAQPVTDNGGSLTVDGYVGVTQSGSWTVTAVQPTASLLNAQVQGTAADGAAPVGNPVLTAGYDGTNVQTILTDTSGRTRVVGSDAHGGAITSDPVRIAFSDGANTRNALSDANGRLKVTGDNIDGAAINDNKPIMVGGTDNTNSFIFRTDSTGRIVNVGAAADGSPPAGAPLLMAGQDGTNVQSIFTDTTGRQVMVGAAADGTAVAGNPVLMAGQDGTNVQSLATDGYGALVVTGRNLVGSPPTQNPVVIGGWDGTNVVRLRLNTDGSIATSEKELATFTALATSTSLSNNKSVFSIVNTSGSLVVAKISAIYLTSVQTASVTGVAGFFELHRIVTHTGGTAITAIETLDSTDVLSGSVTVRTGATVGTESANLLWRAQFSTDEWNPSTQLDVSAENHLLTTMFPVWNRKDRDNKPIVLRANEGLTVKFATNSTVGTMDIMVVFTQE